MKDIYSLWARLHVVLAVFLWYTDPYATSAAVPVDVVAVPKKGSPFHNISGDLGRILILILLLILIVILQFRLILKEAFALLQAEAQKTEDYTDWSVLSDSKKLLPYWRLKQRRQKHNPDYKRIIWIRCRPTIFGRWTPFSYRFLTFLLWALYEVCTPKYGGTWRS